MNEITNSEDNKLVTILASKSSDGTAIVSPGPFWVIDKVVAAAMQKMLDAIGIPREFLVGFANASTTRPTAAERLGLPETAGPFLAAMDDNPESVKTALGVFADWLDERDLDPDLAFACRWLHVNSDAVITHERGLGWRLFFFGRTLTLGIINNYQNGELAQILQSCRDRLKGLRSVFQL